MAKDLCTPDHYTHIVVLLQTVATDLQAWNWILQFPFTGTKESKLFQHNNTLEHKARTWCFKIGAEELECPAHSHDFNPTEHLWNDPPLSTSVTRMWVNEHKSPQPWFKTQWKNFPRRVEVMMSSNIWLFFTDPWCKCDTLCPVISEYFLEPPG